MHRDASLHFAPWAHKFHAIAYPRRGPRLAYAKIPLFHGGLMSERRQEDEEGVNLCARYAVSGLDAPWNFVCHIILHGTLTAFCALYNWRACAEGCRSLRCAILISPEHLETRRAAPSQAHTNITLLRTRIEDRD